MNEFKKIEPTPLPAGVPPVTESMMSLAGKLPPIVVIDGLEFVKVTFDGEEYLIRLGMLDI